MTHYICATCGTQYPDGDAAPTRCPICEDERQYIGWDGQQWTTMEALRQKHCNRIEEEEPGLISIGSEPAFAIGQRALLVTRTPAAASLQAPEGNFLWDCITLLDDQTVEAIESRGGIRAIAISHPHYYSAMIEWSHAFAAPIYLHEDDRQWVMRPDPAVHFWNGETLAVDKGLTLIRCGGHFRGGTVLHWAQGANGRGALLTGDIIDVAQDRRWVSFMYSFPNKIPLNATAVRRVVAAVEPFEFDRIYGAWSGRVVFDDAKAAVRRSAERYIHAIT